MVDLTKMSFLELDTAYTLVDEIGDEIRKIAKHCHGMLPVEQVTDMCLDVVDVFLCEIEHEANQR